MGLKVLVSGGGIAGATLAALLGRSGHQVTVVERDPGVRSSGAPVDIRHGAQQVMARLGLTEELRRHATNVGEAVFIDGDGAAVAGMRTSRQGRGEMEIPRADLSRILLSTARDDVDLRFGATINHLESDPGGVQATFDGSIRSERFDLVVGADGVRSNVRRLVFGSDVSFSRYLGVQVATVPIPDAPVRPGCVILYSRPGRTIAVHPGSDTPGAAFLFRGPDPGRPDRSAIDELVRRAFDGFGWKTGRLVQAYCDADDRYFDVVRRINLRIWTKGRITLLGDAASSVTLFGEGSSSAIVGAATLAQTVTDHPDLQSALARYESVHRRYTVRYQRGALLASHLLIPATRAGLMSRHLMLRMLQRALHHRSTGSTSD